MIKDTEIISFSDLNTDEIKALSFGNRGIERESLRINKSNLISNESHGKYLGSALCQKYLTTDFSEALLEIISPPYERNNEVISFLNETHHYVTKKIQDEKLWPFSMPPKINDDQSIPIAQYGTSNSAKFKTTYREGLAYRYGKRMQAISGVHFNYSFPDNFWKFNKFKSKNLSDKQLKEIVYFRAMRNIHRMNWIILYFFGASPIFDKSFLKQDQKEFKRYKNSLYLPHATSIRMSELGYQNINQSNLRVSINSLKNYVDDLYRLTSTHNPDFNFSDK